MKIQPAARRRSLAVAALAVCVSASGMSVASATPHRAVTKAQVDRIVRFTGFQGLRSHRLNVASAFRAAAAEVEVVRLDGAKLAVPLREVRRDIARADSLAVHGITFTSKVKLGHGPKQRITYNVSPSGTPQGSNLRYIIFAPRNESLDALTQPQQARSVQALTVIRGEGRLSVTLVHDRSRGATLGTTGLPYANLCTLIESLNATNRITVSPATLQRLAKQHVDLSYLTDPNHPNPSRSRELTNLAARGAEIWSNSLGFAMQSAKTGLSYHSYTRRLSRQGFAYYKQNEMHYLLVSVAQYAQFAQSS